jgi:hypothetical protein
MSPTRPTIDPLQLGRVFRGGPPPLNIDAPGVGYPAEAIRWLGAAGVVAVGGLDPGYVAVGMGADGVIIEESGGTLDFTLPGFHATWMRENPGSTPQPLVSTGLSLPGHSVTAIRFPGAAYPGDINLSGNLLSHFPGANCDSLDLSYNPIASLASAPPSLNLSNTPITEFPLGSGYPGFASLNLSLTGCTSIQADPADPGSPAMPGTSSFAATDCSSLITAALGSFGQINLSDCTGLAALNAQPYVTSLNLSGTAISSVDATSPFLIYLSAANCPISSAGVDAILAQILANSAAANVGFVDLVGCGTPTSAGVTSAGALINLGWTISVS